MKTEKYKLFWKPQGKNKEVDLVKWEENTNEYYAFVKEQVKNGYRQISVTTELFLGYISKVAQYEQIDITKIELMEDDSEETDELNELVDASRRNRGLWIKIIERLRYLEDESSIEIRKIYFSERLRAKEYGSFFIQVNGIVGTSNDDALGIKKLVEFVKETIE